VEKIDEEAAKQRVKEAAWEWIQRTVVLLVTFGFGFFAAWVLYGSGTQGAPALRVKTTELEAQITDLKNARVGMQSQLDVATGRLGSCDREKQKCLTERAECRQTLIKAGIEQ
jgi:hypothetical protein